LPKMCPVDMSRKSACQQLSKPVSRLQESRLCDKREESKEVGRAVLEGMAHRSSLRLYWQDNHTTPDI
jgi:hypothetical protein